MSDPTMKDVQGWTQYLDARTIPVLQRTVHALSALHANEDNITSRDISQVILHDPFMTLNVLRYLQSHKSKHQQTDITTIAHAILMLGLGPFFKNFSQLPVIEELLATQPSALEGLQHVMSRARHAALYAQEWSAYRHDIESDEVMIAALLHDLAEMLMWCFAPIQALTIQDLKQKHPLERSAVLQQQAIGFPLQDLQYALISAWHLPSLLQALMDDRHSTAPRTQNVHWAVSLARHSATSWQDPALPDDFKGIAQFLNLAPEQVFTSIRRITLQAARDSDWYNVRPAACNWIG